MTSVTPTTGQGTPESSNLPLLTSFILIGGFILVLAILLGGMTPAEDASAEPTVVAEAGTVGETVVEVTPVPLNVVGEGQPTPAPTEVAAVPEAAAVAFPYTDAQITEGGTVFMGLCSACHGMNARGIVGIGKDLIGGEFSLTTPDDQLHAFVLVGRQPWDVGNTTGQAMPARGGNPMLTDAQLFSVIAYLRDMQLDQGFVPVGYEAIAAAAPVSSEPTLTPTAAPPTLIPTATVLARATPEAVQSGEVIVADTTPFVMAFDVASEYLITCSGCHGNSGEGDGLLTPPLDAASETFMDDEAVYTLLTISDPFSGGYIHPVYPQYIEENLRAIIDYTQSLVAP
mgnify:CR=1 FL=1